jgi:hypothetical protein
MADAIRSKNRRKPDTPIVPYLFFNVTSPVDDLSFFSPKEATSLS